MVVKRFASSHPLPVSVGARLEDRQIVRDPDHRRREAWDHDDRAVTHDLADSSTGPAELAEIGPREDAPGIC
jgi:hypothetical protein